MGKKHRHAELIKAWADGTPLQKRYPLANNAVPQRADWHDFEDDFYPDWEANWIEYRIKPEPKPDFYSLDFICLCDDGDWVATDCEPANIKLTFDGETRKLKAAEVLYG